MSIPGVDFGDGTPGSGNFRVVEPRPVFVDGRVVYLTSIIPNSANAVSKTVVVDAETNKLVAIFDNDRDPQAEEKTLRYVETGEIPSDAQATGGAAQDTEADRGRGPGGGGTGTTRARRPPTPRTSSGASTTSSAASASCSTRDRGAARAGAEEERGGR